MVPHWERGYRCHGYWIGTARYGRVSIGPREFTLAKRDGYTWSFLTPSGGEREGHCRSLRAGKRIVELLYEEWYGTKSKL